MSRDLESHTSIGLTNLHVTELGSPHVDRSDSIENFSIKISSRLWIFEGVYPYSFGILQKNSKRDLCDILHNKYINLSKSTIFYSCKLVLWYFRVLTYDYDLTCLKERKILWSQPYKYLCWFSAWDLCIFLSRITTTSNYE